MFEYWLNYNFKRMRYRMDDFGHLVDVEKGCEHETLKFGGQVGHHLASHQLAQGEGYLSFFSGYCNWRLLGKAVKDVEDTSVRVTEKRLIVCFVKDGEAFVIIDPEGKPMTRSCQEQAPLELRKSEFFNSGELVDITDARTRTVKKRVTHALPGNPPRSPYL